MNNLLIAQSGGPTAVINASLAGAVQEASTSGLIDTVYGAKNGIEGVLKAEFIEFETIITNVNDYELLSHTPSSALGSCRYVLDNWIEKEDEYLQFIRIMRENQIAYFIYIGGNDSMDTVNKLSNYCKKKKIFDIKIIGVPKTIDNDLKQTDHCPGFGSAAKYIATTVAELERDVSVYDAPSITIIEIMGRNTGWLTAASALSRINGADGPKLIYLCEKPFDFAQFILDVKETMNENVPFLIAVSEGLKDKNGHYISEKEQEHKTDAFGHKYIAGTGKVLADLIRDKIGCKVRTIELNLMQRCAGHIVSTTDLNESKMLGMKAVQCAIEGKSGEMVSLKRLTSNPYTIELLSIPVNQVANYERQVPPSFIHPNGHDVTADMMQYLFPLIQGEEKIIYENGIPKHMIV